jgi:hypothetical protein
MKAELLKGQSEVGQRRRPRRMEAKLVGVPDKVSVWLYLCGYPERTPATGKVENGERHIRQYDMLMFQ